MTRTATTVTTIALAALFAVTMGCSSLRSLASAGTGAKPAAKSQKDIAACEKMCEMAGDADANKGAITKCQKDCRS
jgi:hypothetical protein